MKSALTSTQGIVLGCSGMAEPVGFVLPIILLFNEFLGFLIAQMTGDRGVVMGSDDVHVQRIVVRDVHLTGEIVEEAIMFLADPFLLA